MKSHAHLVTKIRVGMLYNKVAMERTSSAEEAIRRTRLRAVYQLPLLPTHLRIFSWFILAQRRSLCLISRSL